MTPQKYMDEVLDIIEKNSIRRDSVNFKHLKGLINEKLKTIDSIEACYPLIEYTLTELKDHHSIFMPKAQKAKWESTSKTKTINELITFSGKTLNNNIGYISMKGFNSGDSISIQTYADSLQSTIKSIDHKNIKGWILDLRKNTGGNCWPMLAGVGPLLNEGICGYFIDRKHKKSSWFYKNGETGMDSTIITKISKTPYKLINETPCIAVLTSSKTCSSGEVVTVAFRNKKNTKSFGEPTAGLTTGNTQFDLSDGSAIFLTTSIYADRKGVVFGGKINPDELLTEPSVFTELHEDPVIKRATEWIYEKH
ncbi:S41 family peptidase [Formosa sp. A9]|uniref:S41 family peptidase n=1 Tax=Formosa sp. A9 TaxID=3442641 RepID=UPI003EB98725